MARRRRGRRISAHFWLTLLLFVALAASLAIAHQRDVAWRAAEARAQLANARAASAEAALTAVVATESATATALALTGAPTASLTRALDLLLAVERDPTEAHLTALSDAFAPPALNMTRPEIEHLLSGGLRLGGDSGYSLDVLSVNQVDDQATVETREHWTYDERDAQDHQLRCVQEQTDQTYTLQRTSAITWVVENVQLKSSSRNDCG
jgi:hypothetical protein